MEDNANKETRDLEDEFIKTYEHLPELWNPDHAHYTNKHKRNAAHDVLLQVLRKWDPEATRYSVRKKINVLRSCYRKVLHKYLASRTVGPDGEEIYEYEPKYSKFHMLRFLDDKLHLQHNNTVEINIDDNYYEDDDGNENNDSSYQKRDVLALEDENNHIVINQNHVNERKVKRLKVEQLYPVNAEVLDRELEAIGANVACKLKRMDPEQRYHAELLINKVLITGLRNNLTEGTDFTEVYKK
ncbi:uncharacterized protein LOC113494230 [Trichoplusia ni]|uniref:Uncharacterized protein LOC113494230 n=1 Tax=Trichoplusia ni TaxID=7111 RepID=A0A7E5VJ99_TRINI|nr:uncharacterized protein LOC113494230 [Trichoplusia ni]